MRALKKKVRFISEMQDVQLDIQSAFSKTVYGTDDGFFEQLIAHRESIKPFESPDMYFQSEEIIVGIEHFQFDSYKSPGRKGSKGVQNVQLANTEMEHIARTREPKNEPFCISRTIQADMSLDFYIQNLLSAFDRHYGRIRDYKQNIAKATGSNNVKVCFYIVDKTPFGNYFVTENGRHLLEPFLLRKVMRKIEQATDLDYIIFSIRDQYFTKLRFFQNTTENHTLFAKSCHKSKGAFLTYDYELQHSYHPLGEKKGECI